MFEETKCWFLDQVKIHFAALQKPYLQWQWRTAEKMFSQFKEGRALTAIDPPPAVPIKKRQKKRIRIVEPPKLLVIPE